jgi:tripartite-type tricarboxylate transporter receptor subunit TctC
MMHRSLYIVSIAVGLCLLAPQAPAQNWPVKAVRLVVPYPPGGALDFTTRLVAQKLQESLGQQMLVDNRSGGGGMIGAEIVAKSAPDGYTVLFCSPAEITINPHVFRKMAYEPLRDFSPVTHHVTTPLVLAVHPSLPTHTLKRLIDLSRQRPGQLTYASAGVGGVQHLAGELLKSTAKINIVHIPYKGAGPAVIDMVGGQVAMGFLGLPPSVPHIRANKLRALGVTSAKRSQALADVATFAESGYPSFDIVNWFGVLVPAATPRDIVNRLNSEVRRAIALADVKDKMLNQGAEPIGTSVEAFDAFLKAETQRYAKLVKESGAKAD